MQRKEKGNRKKREREKGNLVVTWPWIPSGVSGDGAVTPMPFPWGLCPPWFSWVGGVVVLLIHTVAYFFSSPQLRPSSCVQKWKPGSKCEVLWSDPLPPSSLFPSPPLKRVGGEQRGQLEAVRGGVSLAVAQSGSFGITGGRLGRERLSALPSHTWCPPSWSPRALWFFSPFSSRHLLGNCPLVTRGSRPVWIWTLSLLGPSWGELCQIPEPLPSLPPSAFRQHGTKSIRTVP